MSNEQQWVLHEKLQIHNPTARYDKSDVTSYLKIESLLVRSDQYLATYHRRFSHRDDVDVVVKRG